MREKKTSNAIRMGSTRRTWVTEKQRGNNVHKSIHTLSDKPFCVDRKQWKEDSIRSYMYMRHVHSLFLAYDYRFSNNNCVSVCTAVAVSSSSSLSLPLFRLGSEFWAVCDDEHRTIWMLLSSFLTMTLRSVRRFYISILCAVSVRDALSNDMCAWSEI